MSLKFQALVVTKWLMATTMSFDKILVTHNHQPTIDDKVHKKP